jgi:hypothetical protein
MARAIESGFTLLLEGSLCLIDYAARQDLLGLWRGVHFLNSPISMAASTACLWRCTPEASSFCWIVVTGSMNMATTRLVLPAKIFWTSRRSVSENGADSNRVKSVSKVIEQFGDHVPQWH